MYPITGGVEPLCDVCNRNRYPCHCRLAKDNLIVGCKYFVRVLSAEPAKRKSVRAKPEIDACEILPPPF